MLAAYLRIERLGSRCATGWIAHNDNSEGTDDFTTQGVLIRHFDCRRFGHRHDGRSRERLDTEGRSRTGAVGGGWPRLWKYSFQPAQADKCGKREQAHARLFVLAGIASLE